MYICAHTPLYMVCVSQRVFRTAEVLNKGLKRTATVRNAMGP